METQKESYSQGSLVLVERDGKEKLDDFFLKFEIKCPTLPYTPFPFQNKTHKYRQARHMIDFIFPVDTSGLCHSDEAKTKESMCGDYF